MKHILLFFVLSVASLSCKKENDPPQPPEVPPSAGCNGIKFDTLQITWRMPLHQDTIKAFTFKPLEWQGKLVHLFNWNGPDRFRALDVKTGKLLWETEAPDIVDRSRAASYGQWFIYAWQNRLHVLNVESAQITTYNLPYDKLWQVGFGPDGKALLVATDEQPDSVHIHGLVLEPESGAIKTFYQTKKSPKVLNAYAMHGLKFSQLPGGETVYAWGETDFSSQTGNLQHYFTTWHPATGIRVRQPLYGNDLFGLNNIQVQPEHAAVLFGDTLYTYRLSDGNLAWKRPAEVDGKTVRINYFYYSKSTNQLVLFYNTYVEGVQPETGKTLWRFKHLGHPPAEVAEHNGRLYWADEYTAYVYEINLTGGCWSARHEHPGPVSTNYFDGLGFDRSIQISADGKRLYVANYKFILQAPTTQ